MIIGVPKETKSHEYRVGLTPSSVLEITKRGHKVLIESTAGVGIGASDQEYIDSGAEIAENAKDIFAVAKMIVKVKELQPEEYDLINENHILFTYLHLAPDLTQADSLIASGAAAIGYETITDDAGTLPLLTPMSEIAGRISIQIGAHYLEAPQGGSGVLLSGAHGVRPGHVMVIGGGAVGINAARIALGIGAEVSILDNNTVRLKEIDEIYKGNLSTIYSTESTIESELKKSDLVIGAVLVAGASAPKIVTKDMLSLMKPNSVMIDVAVDQGGCFETTRPTSHDDPIFKVDTITHYAVGNMPGAVPHTSNYALNNATLPYVLKLADKGLDALKEDQNFLNGLNVYKGKITHKAVADALGKDFADPAELL